jgi:release factor glutamine methyltransferase
MNLLEAIRFGAQTLSNDPRLSDPARRDVELLLLHLLGISRATLLAEPTRELTPEQLRAYETMIERRLRHEPIQYIVGQQEFYGLPLRVTPDVLIPRPETEHLVEAVLERLPHDRPLNIVDIGTGSGAIAIAFAKNLPLAWVTALDLSPAALAVARGNAEANGVENQMRFLESDLLQALSKEEQQRYFDAIVSNPPYIPTTEAAELHPQVREHEPALALFAGIDGLDVYRRLIPAARLALKPGGLLALEIGYGQSPAIATLLSHWNDVEFVEDLQGIPRVALAHR